MSRIYINLEKKLKQREISGRPISQTWFEQTSRGLGLCPDKAIRKCSSERIVTRFSKKKFYPLTLNASKLA